MACCITPAAVAAAAAFRLQHNRQAVHVLAPQHHSDHAGRDRPTLGPAASSTTKPPRLASTIVPCCVSPLVRIFSSTSKLKSPGLATTLGGLGPAGLGASATCRHSCASVRHDCSVLSACRRDNRDLLPAGMHRSGAALLWLMAGLCMVCGPAVLVLCAKGQVLPDRKCPASRPVDCPTTSQMSWPLLIL